MIFAVSDYASETLTEMVESPIIKLCLIVSQVALGIGSQKRLSRHLGHGANFSSCPPVRPVIFTPASRSRCQVFLGLPLLLLPCGFQRGHVLRCMLQACEECDQSNLHISIVFEGFLP